MKKLFFFGCGSSVGHYWFDAGGKSVADYYVAGTLGVSKRLIQSFDSMFCPNDDKQLQGIYKVSSVPPALIISWWDRTIDHRPGSNSNLIGIGYFGSHEMFEDARKLFPSFMDRQTILDPEKI